jgi:8-oxo-dGTP diphosphatase
VFDEAERLLLIRRRNPPFQGEYALPGGFVDIGETVEAAALRELKEETGLVGTIISLVGVFSDPKRDPRRHTVSVAYRVRVPAGSRPVGGDDAERAEFVVDWRNTRLAFDHRAIVEDALRVR